MSGRRLCIASLACTLIAAALLVALRFSGPTSPLVGLDGPLDSTVVSSSEPTPWTRYHKGGDSRLSILLTDTNSAWLGLAHGLRAAGIPFSITTDYREALRHKVIMVYPVMSGLALQYDALRALAAVPRSGGTLIGVNVLGGGMNEVFGFGAALPSRSRYRMELREDASEIRDSKESWLPLGDLKAGEAVVGSYGYTEPRETPLATFEDGTAAITTHHVGAGLAYAFGLDVGALLLKGYNNREESVARSYVNDFEPTLDVLLRLLGRIYRQGDGRAVTLEAVPDGKDLAVMITHDIDYTVSLANSIAFARFEQEAGVRATYFIQAKYIKDWSDDVILGPAAPSLLNELKAMGVELASHGVSHSRAFNTFPLGDGRESYPAYRPFVVDRTTTKDGTILGELRVSRFIIEQLTPGVRVASFRPGYLSNPYTLPQAMAATGYLYSSSVTANNSLTHLPFQLNFGRDVTAEVPVFEFPVAIEDEAAPFLGDRLPQAVELAKKIARHGGICVVLIHPNVVDRKLGFERAFVDSVKGYSWFGAMEDYGSWWASRNDVEIDVERQGDRQVINLFAPTPIRGLTLTVSDGLRPDIDGSAPTNVRIAGNRLILDKVVGQISIALKRGNDARGAAAFRHSVDVVEYHQ